MSNTGLHLLPDEEVLSLTHVPFVANGPRLGLDLIVDLLTDSKAAMPVASRDLDGGDSQGLFEVEFPRDALTMAAFVDVTMPELTEVIVRRLVEVQGLVDKSEDGKYSDREEPGRIPHEMRDPDSARACEYTEKYGWQWPYFGAIDTTPLFVDAVARAAKRNPQFLQERIRQSDGVERTISQALIKAIEWMWNRLKASPDGLLETGMASNNCWQAWQDSPDAYHHADGALARGYVAPIEVQGFVYDALTSMIDLMRLHLIPGDPNYIWTVTQRLRRTIIERMWVINPDTGGYFAQGLERHNGEFRTLNVRAANMAMLLNSRLLEGPAYQRYLTAIIHQLFEVDGLMSPMGVRTLASNEIRFRPEGYHTGSVWPWQNLWIAKGLRHHDRSDLALRIEERMATIVDYTLCAPEFVQGGNSLEPQMNEALVELRSPDGHGGFIEHLAMQPAQKFQGWTAFGLYALELSGRLKYPLNA